MQLEGFDVPRAVPFDPRDDFQDHKNHPVSQNDLVAEVLIGLATDETVCLGRRGEALAVNN